MAVSRIVLPVSDTVTIRQTVNYAITSLLESEAPDRVCHLVVPLSYDINVPEGQRELEAAEELLDRATTWVEEDAGEDDLTIITEVLAQDEYLFGPRDFARVIAEYAKTVDIDKIVLDPEYRTGTSGPLIQPIERELGGLGVPFEKAPVERPAQHEQIIGQGSFDRLFGMFWIAFAFYLVLGDPTYWYDIVTGAFVAGMTSVMLSHVTFGLPPGRLESPLRTIRFGLFIPYLVYEIVKANVSISIAILRPSLPIDPRMTRFEARVGSGLPLLALANSITLTPGTLTVRANDQRLLVHTLTVGAREDLFNGRLERAVRFVFHGRESAAIATPEERGDAEVIGWEEQ
ncbi:MAG: monovalent cation/H+ antiporter subunit E [Natrialbaceae archaeon]|nr:monovalent cation/H+ antiporter subunit E [Natrialbaceae archaeon]